MEGKLFHKYLPQPLDACFPCGKFTSTQQATPDTPARTGKPKLSPSPRKGIDWRLDRKSDEFFSNG